MLCRARRTEGISLVNSLAWFVDTPVGKSMKAFPALFVYSFLLPFLITSSTPETITPSQSIIIDGETLVSDCGNFELGFFSPGRSKNRYVGIWYVVYKGTVVWVANRETPLENHSWVLKVIDKGILVLLDSTANTTVWSSNNTPRTAGNKINSPIAKLLDSGNLVVKDENISDQEKFLWQGFDYPCNTFLPEMKISWDLGLDRYITSWKGMDNPAQVEFSGGIDRRGLTQIVVASKD